MEPVVLKSQPSKTLSVPKRTILLDIGHATKSKSTGENLSTEKSYDNFPQSAVVYTDGSCINNGKEHGASDGIGVFWAPGHHLNVRWVSISVRLRLGKSYYLCCHLMRMVWIGFILVEINMI